MSLCLLFTVYCLPRDQFTSVDDWNWFCLLNNRRQEIGHFLLQFAINPTPTDKMNRRSLKHLDSHCQGCAPIVGPVPFSNKISDSLCFCCADLRWLSDCLVGLLSMCRVLFYCGCAWRGIDLTSSRAACHPKPFFLLVTHVFNVNQQKKPWFSLKNSSGASSRPPRCPKTMGSFITIRQRGGK